MREPRPNRGERHSPVYLDRLFGALADATRRDLLVRLSLGPSKVTDLARHYRISLPAVSKHLRILEQAGLISRRVNGRVHRLTLEGKPLELVEVWLDPFRSYWAHTLGAMRRTVEAERDPPARRRRRSSRRPS
jgi:DNA-binding transcriptional ArsR family regulator